MNAYYCLHCATVLEQKDKPDHREYTSTWFCPADGCEYKVSFYIEGYKSPLYDQPDTED